MNKICTSIEQSLKLIELGIDVNTADMYYPNRVGGHNYPLPIEYKMGFPLLSQEIPTWSLSALLKMLPLPTVEETPITITKTKWKCTIYYNAKYWSELYNDAIDAAFEMVCWLLENKKI
jgi:hypothetical protein